MDLNNPLNNNNDINTQHNSNIKIDSKNHNIELFSVFMDGLKKRDFKEFKNILYNSLKLDINFEIVMIHLILNSIEDEELYNILYLKRGFIIPYNFLCGDMISKVESNFSLIRTIARRGLITNNKQNKIIHYREPVHYFIKTNRLSLAEKVLDVGFSIDQPDNQGMTPIFLCIKLNNIQFFNKILHKYHPDLRKKDLDDQTVFEYILQSEELSEEDKEEFFKILVQYKNSQFTLNASIENTHISEETLIQAINARNCDLIKIILEKRPSLSNHVLPNGKTIMNNLIERIIDDEEIFDILFKQRAYIDEAYIKKYGKNELAKDPVFLIERNIGLIKSIIKNGFYMKDKNNEVKYISTPVVYFTRNMKNHLVELLLKNGASVDEKSDNQLEYSAFFYSIVSKNFSLFKTMLYQYHPKLYYETPNNKLYDQIKVTNPLALVSLTSGPKITARYINEIYAYVELMKNEHVEESNLSFIYEYKERMFNTFNTTRRNTKSSKNNKMGKDDIFSVSSIQSQNQNNDTNTKNKNPLRKIKSEFILRSKNNSEEKEIKAVWSDDE